MNIKCLTKGHEWRFSYNHGIPAGCTDEQWDKLIKDSYEVSECNRCREQGRLINGKMAILNKRVKETP